MIVDTTFYRYAHVLIRSTVQVVWELSFALSFNLFIWQILVRNLRISTLHSLSSSSSRHSSLSSYLQYPQLLSPLCWPKTSVEVEHQGRPSKSPARVHPEWLKGGGGGNERYMWEIKGRVFFLLQLKLVFFFFFFLSVKNPFPKRGKKKKGRRGNERVDTDGVDERESEEKEEEQEVGGGGL